MKLPIKLQDLLQQSQSAIEATSTLIGQGMVILDCTGVESIDDEQLKQLFCGIPQTWDFIKLQEVLDANTLTETLTQQLKQKFSAVTPQSTIIDRPSNIDRPKSLDIFNLRDEIISDYRSYIESFLKIKDAKVKEFVDRELDRGELWSNPLVQLNPSYKLGSTVTDLVKGGILHPDCSRYFSKDGKSFQFYYHQEQAFLAANRQEPYVLTTGTGSGKSLSYVVPIINDLLHNPQIRGVRAILVYPMNALINSQKEEFDKFIKQVPNSHIRVEQYTGQESLQKKTEIQNNPPHILLTNYVMLELMLTRQYEDKLVASDDFKFLVFDELHTYRGRQGADVAILIRKLRQRSGKDLLCIGTSATMSTEGDRENRRQTVADVASKLFSVPIEPENVIDETLERAIVRPYPAIAELQSSLRSSLPPETEKTLKAFQQHPLSAWIEMNFGLAQENGHLVRRTPISLQKGAEKLAEETQITTDTCFNLLKQMFLWGSKTKGLAFRLHQFISQGGNVYATLEKSDRRFLTLEGQYVTTKDRLLYPLVFCRECGQDYYVVRYDRNNFAVTPCLPNTFDPEDLDREISEGYLTLDEPELWQLEDQERLPDNWFKETIKKGRVVRKEYAQFIPQKLYIYPNGKIASSAIAQFQSPSPTPCWFIPKPFLTCLNCGIVHDKRKNEFVKLSRLSSEGRSTATTLLCLSTVSRLKASDAIKLEAAKILSFTDNRQDASLQAGHFNDFVQTSFLRSSLNGALQNNQQLTHRDLAAEVVKCKPLPPKDT